MLLYFKNFIDTVFYDPRHGQIAALTSLALSLIFISDFTASAAQSFAAFAGCISAQYLGFRLFKIPSCDYRSPAITALSLTLLLRAANPWLFFAAGVMAMASKFLIRFDSKHVFNPANIAIVALLLLTPDLTWVSPAQWGRAVWLLVLASGFALLVLSGAKRWDIALAYLCSFALIVCLRALWLGDPLGIPLQQLQSGGLLIFAFFMISDPKTTPDTVWGRCLFAAATAGLAAWLQFDLHLRAGVFYALPVVCIGYVVVKSLKPLYSRALIPARH